MLCFMLYMHYFILSSKQPHKEDTKPGKPSLRAINNLFSPTINKEQSWLWGPRWVWLVCMRLYMHFVLFIKKEQLQILDQCFGSV